MPIKKSALEKKWYYRTAKVFFLVFPFLAAAYFFFINGFPVPEITQQNAFQILKENSGAIIFGIIGLIAYYVILGIIWKMFAYIFFGGVENDAKIGGLGGQTPATGAEPQKSFSREDQKQIGFYLFLLFIIGVVYYAYFIWRPAGIDIIPGGKRDKKCIATGCGTQWFCSGSYYENGMQKRINGCVQKNAGETYSSWSGECRQCP